jgi:hypothetical protein
MRDLGGGTGTPFGAANVAEEPSPPGPFRLRNLPQPDVV